MVEKKIRVPVAVSSTTEHLSKAFLRMIPFIPGPEIYDLINDLTRTRTSLDKKIQRAQESLIETSSLITELEAGLKERVEKVNQLKEEYDKYSKLAEVEEGKAKAIIQQIELTIGRGKGKERLISLFLNLFAGIIVFLLGVFLGPHITNMIGISKAGGP